MSLEINVFLNEFLDKIKSAQPENDDRETTALINIALDKLNALSASKNVSHIQVPNIEEALLLITNHVIPKLHSQLFVKFCHLLFNLHTKKQVELSTDCASSLVQCLLSALRNGRDVWIVPDILNALSSILYENVGQLRKFWEDLIGPTGLLKEWIQDLESKLETRISALKCLQNICIKKCGEDYLTEDYLLVCLRLFLDTLQTTLCCVKDVNDVHSAKILSSTLRGLRNLLVGWKHIPVDHIGELLGTVRVLLFYGLRGGEPMQYECLYPVPIGQFISQNNADVTNSHEKSIANRKKTRKKRASTRKGGKMEVHVGNASTEFGLQPSDDTDLTAQPSWRCSSSSDSEFSDSEAGNLSRIRHAQAKVRYHAYSVLQAANFSTEKRAMFGYWSSFIPDIPGPSTASQGKTVLMTILKDPSPQVRGAAISFLADLLSGSKLFLGIAEESVSPRTSFIPLSATLAGVIHEMHRSLLLAVVAENAPNLIIQLLKCYSVLVSNVPYHRLKSGLLINLVKQLQPLFNHQDLQVRVACLTLLSCIVRTHPPTGELSEIINGNFLTKQKLSHLRITENASTNEESKKWLLDVCYQNVFGSADEWNTPLSTQVAALQLLTDFIHGFFSILRPHMDVLEKIIIAGMQHSDLSIQLHAAKAFEVLGRCTLEEIEKGTVNKTESVNMWTKFLRGPVPNCLQNKTNSSLRAVGCDCLSNVGGEIFDTLPKDLQIMCLTLTLGLAKDEDANVRGAAVRCLGVFCLYPCLQEVVMFLMDIGEAVVALLDDSNSATAVKASWALGNLSDALLLKKEFLQPELSITFIQALGRVSIKAAIAQDKIQANAVRALGNILRYVPLDSLGESEMKDLVHDAVACLLSKLDKTPVKVQWNTCYALATMLQNTDLLSCATVNLNDVFTSLLGVMEKSNNFKVRINCASALTVLPTRNLYQNYYSRIWGALLNALKTCERSVDFRELKHRDNLLEQICISLTQLIVVMERKDIEDIAVATISAETLLIMGYQKLGSSGKVCNIEGACLNLEARCSEDKLGTNYVAFLKKLNLMLHSYFSTSSSLEDTQKDM